LIEISIINAYKVSLHSAVSKKAEYTVHSEFRTALATGLIQASERQFLKRKRTSTESAIERSMVRLDDHRICKRKSLGDCRGCKEIGQVATPILRGEGFSEKSHQIWVVTSGESVLLLAAILAISPYAKTFLVGLPITIASIKWVQNDSPIVSIVPIGRISEYAN